MFDQVMLPPAANGRGHNESVHDVKRSPAHVQYRALPYVTPLRPSPRWAVLCWLNSCTRKEEHAAFFQDAMAASCTSTSCRHRPPPAPVRGRLCWWRTTLAGIQQRWESVCVWCGATWAKISLSLLNRCTRTWYVCFSDSTDRYTWYFQCVCCWVFSML